MAHLVESMMSVGKTPWHFLGKVIENAPTAAEAIVNAGLDWEVRKTPSMYQAQDGSYMSSKNKFCIVRNKDDAYLGYAGTGYQVLQNKEAFSFFDPFIQAGEAVYETAGALCGGKKVWVLAKINRPPVEIVKGDIVEKYILLSHEHCSGVSIRTGGTPIRVVCANTLRMALGGNLIRVTHSKKMQDRLAEAQVQIAKADEAFMKTAEYYKQFAKKQIKSNDVKKFVNTIFHIADNPKDGRETAFAQKQLETIMRLFETGRGSDIAGVRGTVWGLYNAATEYIQYEIDKTPEKRLDKAWFGRGMQLNELAFRTASQMVGVA